MYKLVFLQMHIHADFWETEGQSQKDAIFSLVQRMLHHTEFHFGKIEQTPHQSDIEYTSFAATSLIHPYMTSMTKMLNAFCSKRCTWCWFATKPHLFCKGHYITLLGPAWGKIVNNPVWFAAVCCLDGLMLPVHYKRRKMKIYTSYSLQRTGTADRHTVILD